MTEMIDQMKELIRLTGHDPDEFESVEIKWSLYDEGPTLVSARLKTVPEAIEFEVQVGSDGSCRICKHPKHKPGECKHVYPDDYWQKGEPEHMCRCRQPIASQ